jgi:SAM-dependent methyltransferase
MSKWSSGYVADIDYTYGYYAELNPIRSKFVLLDGGIVPPRFDTACELGFGQGLSANIHAAATETEWYGTDFNPAQAGFAQELVAASGSNAQLFDEAFAEFCTRSDLPDFDFISMHGIWSWVSDENRSVIADFIRRKLKVGGVLYVSYNTPPGWATFTPLRHLMSRHAQSMGSPGGGTVNRIDGALKFAEKLIASNPAYVAANPKVSERVTNIKELNRHYLAHEFFNRDWEPMDFSTMANWLEPAKVDFACSAHYMDQIEAINMTQDQIAFMKEIPDPILRQSVRDFMVNAQFRKDYWIKGRRRLLSHEQAELIRNFRMVLCVNRDEIEVKAKGNLGEANVNMAVYDPILDLMADSDPITLGEIIDTLSGKDKIGYGEVVQAALILMNGGYAAAAQTDDEIATAERKTAALNAHLLSKSKGGSEISYFASPVTGGGIPLAPFQQQFLISKEEGSEDPNEWAEATWKVLAERGRKLVIDGKQLESDEENLQELRKRASVFARLDLPVLKKLKVL